MSKTQESRREFWRRLVAEQQQSGQSVRAICRQRGASEHSFYQWRKRLAAQLPMKFALVEAGPGAPCRAEPIEVVLATGDRLRIGPGFEAATLRAVLGVLREPR
jgi:transposase-like protein